MFNENKKLSKSLAVFDSLEYYTLLLITAIMPVFVFFGSNVSSLVSKIYIGGMLTLLLLAFFSIKHIIKQEISIPKSFILLGFLSIPFVYKLSTFFNSSSSFFGKNFTMDSAIFISIAATVLVLTSIILNTPKKSLGVYLAMLASSIVLMFSELYIFFIDGAVKSFGLQSVSLVGSLNDLAIFFGLITIFILLSLTILPITKIVRFILWGVLVASMFFLAVVNLSPLWWVIGFFSLVFFVYSLYSVYFSGNGKINISKISFASLVVLVISVMFIAIPPKTTTGELNITGVMSAFANVGEVDIRPSINTTISLGEQALADNGFLLGTGPGTFYYVWAKYMPETIGMTLVWLNDFYYGIGFIPTSVITTGLLGALSWLVFFILFLWKGGQNLLSAKIKEGDVADYIRITSFVSALYLWVNMMIQIPSPAIFLYATLFTGVFVASLAYSFDKSKYIRIKFYKKPKLGFLFTLMFTLFILVSVAGMYNLTIDYYAETVYQNAVNDFMQNRNIDNAHKMISRAISLNKVDAYYRFNSNLSILQMNELVAQNKPPEEVKDKLEKYLSESVKDAIEATKLDENDYQNWLNLGNVYKSLVPVGVGGAIDNAMTSYDKVLELRPVSPNVYYVKAVLERARGNNKKAREYVEKAISLRNQYTEAIFLLAQIQVEENDIENAISSVKAITMFNPDNAVAYFQLGLLHYASDDFKTAVQDFNKAVEINPEYANARYFLGLAYWRLGDSTESLKQFKEVKKTNPNNVEVANIIKNLEHGKNPFEDLTGDLDIKDLGKLPIDDVNDGVLKGEENKELSE